MSIARDISRQSSKQNATLTADQTAVTVTGGFSGSSIQVYLNGVKIIQGQDYSLNGTSGITLTQGASAGDIIEFVMRNTSNSGFSAANTGQIVDQAVTFDKLSNSGTEADNVQKRAASAWVNFDGYASPSPYTLDNGGIRSALNVSSVADLGFGKWQINFDTPFSDTNWVMCGTAKFRQATDNNIPNVGLVRNDTTANVAATTHARVMTGYYNNSYVIHDTELVMLAFFGELS